MWYLIAVSIYLPDTARYFKSNDENKHFVSVYIGLALFSGQSIMIYVYINTFWITGIISLFSIIELFSHFLSGFQIVHAFVWKLL